MKNIARDTFQGMCLEAIDGNKTMYALDGLFSPEIRKRIKESPFNLCPVCIWGKTQNPKTDSAYIKTIERFEAAIRSSEKE